MTISRGVPGLFSSASNIMALDSAESKEMVLEALADTPGTPREIVTLNAGAALYTANLAGSVADGIGRAREAIASGAARAKLDEFVNFTQKCK